MGRPVKQAQTAMDAEQLAAMARGEAAQVVLQANAVTEEDDLGWWSGRDFNKQGLNLPVFARFASNLDVKPEKRKKSAFLWQGGRAPAPAKSAKAKVRQAKKERQGEPKLKVRDLRDTMPGPDRGNVRGRGKMRYNPYGEEEEAEGQGEAEPDGVDKAVDTEVADLRESLRRRREGQAQAVQEQEQEQGEAVQEQAEGKAGAAMEDDDEADAGLEDQVADVEVMQG